MTAKSQDIKFMKRCLQLARAGEGLVWPNPMVGSVIVFNDRIIGEGWHHKAGEPHAEVNAINAVKEPALLEKATLYVNLEPCAHHGKTPPCALLIRQKRIPRVVIGCTDTYGNVNGKGIHILRAGGVDVSVGILERESRELNRRFFTFHEQKRPYILLKWAQTRDGFLDVDRTMLQRDRPTWITDEWARRIIHRWRSIEPAILVGTQTALLDNPSLTVRDWAGPHPLRLVLDRFGKLPESLTLFNGKVPTLVFSDKNVSAKDEVETICLEPEENPLVAILTELYNRQIQSVMVEGGGLLLSAFIAAGLWDEARVFVGEKWFVKGVKAPVLKALPAKEETFGNNRLFIFRNFNNRLVDF